MCFGGVGGWGGGKTQENSIAVSFFGSVLQSYSHTYELTQMSIKALFCIGSNKETICAKASYPHVTIGPP